MEWNANHFYEDEKNEDDLYIGILDFFVYFLLCINCTEEESYVKLENGQ